MGPIQPGAAIEQLQARTNPRDVFVDLFGRVNFHATTPEMDRHDGLLIDRVVDQYRELRRHRRLSADDRVRLDQYVTLISELQARLTVRPLLSCTEPAEPISMDNHPGTDPDDIAKRWRLHLDLATAALLCDRTRIITLGVHKALGPGPDPNDRELHGHYHTEDASGGTWHGLAHDWSNPNARRMLAGINAWIAEHIFAGLLRRLDVNEADGTRLLDNSLVYWGNELGFNHIAHSVPCLLAGAAGGSLGTGRYLDYVDWEGRVHFSQEGGNVIRGIPHNRFLVSVLRALGLSPKDYERNGQPGYGETSLTGKSAEVWPTDYDLRHVGDPLPGLLRG